MTIGAPSRPPDRLNVLVMALALVLAALIGGAGGLVWNWISGGDAEADSAATASDDASKAETAKPSPTPIALPSPSPGG